MEDLNNKQELYASALIEKTREFHQHIQSLLGPEEEVMQKTNQLYESYLKSKTANIDELDGDLGVMKKIADFITNDLIQTFEGQVVEVKKAICEYIQNIAQLMPPKISHINVVNYQVVQKQLNANSSAIEKILLNSDIVNPNSQSVANSYKG